MPITELTIARSRSTMATPEYFYAAKFGNIRGLQSFLTRGGIPTLPGHATTPQR